MICESSKWTLPFTKNSTHSTPYNRMTTIWKKIYNAALQKAGNTRFDYTEDSQVIDMSCRRAGHHKFTIEELRVLSQDTLIHFIYDLQGLFPKGIAIPDTAFFNLPDDTAERRSFLDSPQAEELFAPIRQKVWAALWPMLSNDNGSMDAEKADCYLQKDQRFLARLAFTLLWMCGKPCRGYNAVDLCYRARGQNVRNLHIMMNNVSLGWPKRSRTTHAGKKNRPAYLLVLPRRIGWGSIAYLGIIRPIIIAIVKMLKRPTNFLYTHIFVDSASAQCSVWHGPQFSNAVRTVLPQKLVSFDDQTFIKLFNSIVREHLAALLPLMELKSNTVSPLNRQGGHKDHTSNFNYGLDSEGHHSAFQMSRIHVESCWAVCEVWQAFWGITPLDNKWTSLMHGNSYFTLQRRLKLAWEVAQRHAMSYFLGCTDSGSISYKIKQVIADHPFFLPHVSK